MRKLFCKKGFSLFACFLLAGVLFFGCLSGSAGAAQKRPQDYKGTITIWYWNKTDEDKVVAEFNKVYPNIKVNVVSVGYDDYMNKVQTSVAADIDMADILEVEMGFRARLLKMDILENLEKAPYKLDRSQMLDYVPAISSYKGKIVGLDSSINAAGLAYKADLAKKYLGTDDPAQLEKMFSTWDVFVQKGKEVQQKSNGSVYLMSCWADLQEYFNNFGTQHYTANNKVTSFTLNQRAAERYKLLKAMLEAKTFDKTIPDHYTPADNATFAKDNHIFYNAATWSVPFVLKANDPNSKGRWRIMQAPGGPFNQGGTLLSIWKGSKNKELAWQYLKWAYQSVEGGEAVAKAISYSIPYKPYLKAHDFSKDNDPYFGNQNAAEKFIKEMAPKVQVRMPEVYQNQVYDSYKAVETAVLNDKANSINLAKYKELLKNELKNRCPDLEW